MTTKSIPKSIKEEVQKLIEQFNQKKLSNSGMEYVARFKGRFLYLDRSDEGNIGHICRLEYTGNMNQWIFAIYKYSSGSYSSDEFFIPGDDHIDGTVQGAMLCGLEAYSY